MDYNSSNPVAKRVAQRLAQNLSDRGHSEEGGENHFDDIQTSSDGGAYIKRMLDRGVSQFFDNWLYDGELSGAEILAHKEDILRRFDEEFQKIQAAEKEAAEDS